jgi:hypothetical protein
MSDWPEPVREPIGARLITDPDIDGALALTVAYLDEPSDPEFGIAMHGFVSAVRGALIECSEALLFEQQALRNAGQYSEQFRSAKISEAVTARRVARRVIDDLRRYLPEVRS